MKQIKINLKPNDNQEYRVILTDDWIVVQDVLLSSTELKDYISTKLSDKETLFLREALKLFKSQHITFTLKD